VTETMPNIPARMLTWEDELRLSDALYEARRVRERLNGAPPTSAKDRAILEAGRAAADELVLAHIPLARRIAYSVLPLRVQSAAMDIEDLVQVGLLAMYSCTNWYDARRRDDGLAKDTGNRFSFYCRQYVRRDMLRAVERDEATLTGSRAAYERTREWMRAKVALAEELGRPPTDDEVAARSGISSDQIDFTLLHHLIRLSQPVAGEGGGDDDSPLYCDPAEQARTWEVDDAIAGDPYPAAVTRVLRLALPPREVEAVSLWLGLDQDMPRTYPEVAREMGLKSTVVVGLVRNGIARLRHPQNIKRVRQFAQDELAQIRDMSLLPSVEGGRS